PPRPGPPGPPYPARPQPPRKSNAGVWIILAIVGLLIALCGGCGAMLGSNDRADDESTTTRATTYAAAPPPVTTARTTAPARPTSNAFTDDEINALAFTMALDSKGIRYSSRDAAVELAQSICDGRRAGNSDTVIAVTIADKGGWSLTDSAYIVGAAEGTYCPEFK
ncbi:DUF732 domain-containing protein, partial [Nocardia sp. No.11]|uniref:DUF732 domain-containing protein n=1 Tax=Nocardia sp. No.11 TaxID=3128861 RepID=UPI00319E2854